MKNTAHIQLLTDAEIESLYARPEFNYTEREGYFYIEDNDDVLVNKFVGLKSKLYFILQLGYFRAKQQFYTFTLEDVHSDCNYILNKYFSSPILSLHGTLSKNIRLKQQKIILTRYHYSRWGNTHKDNTMRKLQQIIKIYPKGHDTLHELLVYFNAEKIIIPTYRTCQDLLTESLSSERKRLITVLEAISADYKNSLEEIIENNNGNSYLNVLRHDQKDFHYFSIKAETQKAKCLATLYSLSKSVIPKLDLSNNAVRYYATLTEH